MTPRVVRKKVSGKDDERGETVSIRERDESRPEEAEVRYFVVHVALHDLRRH